MIKKSDTFESFLNQNRNEKGEEELFPFQNFPSFSIREQKTFNINDFKFGSPLENIEIPQIKKQKINPIISDNKNLKGKKINLDKKNLIKNLSHEIFYLLKKFDKENISFFKRKKIFVNIKKNFKNEKMINLQKRMYDVINIFTSLNILKKKDNLFFINKEKISCESEFEKQHENLIKIISDVRIKKKKITKRENFLTNLKKKMKFYEKVILFNQKNNFVIEKIDEKNNFQNLKREKLKKFNLPITILKLETKPIIFKNRNSNLSVKFGDFKVIKDYELFNSIEK